MPQRDPQFFTIHIPTAPYKTKHAYPAQLPEEINIRVNPSEKPPPAIIEVMGKQCALRSAMAAVEKTNTPTNVKAVVQVEDSTQKIITKVEAKDIVPRQQDQEETVPGSKCNSEIVHTDTGPCDLKLPSQQRNPGGVVSCKTENTNHLPIAGTSSSSQQPLQMSLKEHAMIMSSTPQRKQTPGKHAGTAISETMSKETSLGHASKAEKNLYPLSHRQSETLSLKSILSRQHRYSLNSAAAAKVVTTSRSVLPDYNKLRNNELQSRYRRKSVSFRSSSTNPSSHGQQQQQQQQQRSMSTRTLYDSRPTTIFTRNSRLRPKATWLDVTGTPETWIQPSRSKEPQQTDEDNHIAEKRPTLS